MFIPYTRKKPQAATHSQINGILRFLAHVKSVLYSSRLYYMSKIAHTRRFWR